MADSNQEVVSALLYSLGLNTVVATTKLVAGVLGGSSALVASGLHSAGDLLISTASYGSSHLAAKPADGEHPYGYGRVELIAALLVYISLMIVGYEIIVDAVADLQKGGRQQTPAVLLIVVPLAVVFVKEAFYRYLRDKNKEIKSTLLKATSWHQRADAWGAAIVIIAIGTAGGGGWWQVDRAAAIILGIGIALAGIYGLVTTARELLDVQPEPEVMKQIRNSIEKLPCVPKLASLRARRSGMQIFVEATIGVAADLTIQGATEITKEIKGAVSSAVPTVVEVTTETVPLEELDEAVTETTASPSAEAEDRASPAESKDEIVFGEVKENDETIPEDYSEYAPYLISGAIFLIIVAFTYRALGDINIRSWSGRLFRLGLLYAILSGTVAALGAQTTIKSTNRRDILRPFIFAAFVSVFILPFAGLPLWISFGSINWSARTVVFAGILLAPIVALWSWFGEGKTNERRAYALDLMLICIVIFLLDNVAVGKMNLVINVLIGGTGTTLSMIKLQALLLGGALATACAGFIASSPNLPEGPKRAVLAVALSLSAIVLGRFSGIVPAALFLSLPTLLIENKVEPKDAPLYCGALGAVSALISLRLALHFAIPCGAGATVILLAGVLVFRLGVEVRKEQQACPRC